MPRRAADAKGRQRLWRSGIRPPWLRIGQLGGYAVAYRREWAERRAALWELTRLSEELGLYDDEG